MAKKSSCLEMEPLLTENGGEIIRFSKILEVSWIKGWITEDEKLRVNSKVTLSEKKLELLDLLTTMECEEKAIRLMCAIRSMNEVDSSHKTNEEDGHPFSMKIISTSLDEPLSAQGTELSFENIREEQYSKTDFSEITRRAMLLGPVIRCVLQYLNLSDIKQCRCISKEWKSIAEPILRNRSKIEFSNHNNENPDETLYHPSKFFEQFASTLETLPFTAFSIIGGYEPPWDISELNTFFQHQRKYIKELEIWQLEPKKNFDITPWIEGSPITINNPKYHTKLSIVGAHVALYTLIVQQTILAHVNKLCLSNCTLNLHDMAQLQPLQLTLCGVSFTRDGEQLLQISINDIIDLSQAKYIHLERKILEDVMGREYPCGTQPSLCLRGNNKLNLDYLQLNEVTLTNWRECTWTVDKLMMTGYSFLEKTDMQIRELDLMEIENLDLSVLPQSLKTLTLYVGDLENCFSSQNILLNNLHSLNLTGLEEEYLSSVSMCLSQCPNLIDIDLEDAYVGNRAAIEINSDWISRSARKIKLCGVKVNWGEESKHFNLDKLVLTEIFFRDIEKMGNILIQTKELVLQLHRHINSEDIDNILEYLRSNNSSNPCPRIYVGPFDWTKGYSFEETSLVHYVNSKGRYYIFENQVGKALDISSYEFEELKNIKPN